MANLDTGLKPVTDPDILSQLNSAPKPVTDPDLLRQLNGQSAAPKSFSDRLSDTWEHATPGGPLWMLRETVRGMQGAVAGSEAAVAPQVGTEEEEANRRQTEEGGGFQALRAASMIAPGTPSVEAGNMLSRDMFGAGRGIRREPTPLSPSKVPPPLPAEAAPLRQVERPDVGVDLLPADTPHDVPPARAALSAAGFSGPLSDISPETLAHLRGAMQEQGFNANTLDQRLEEMSAHNFFGEISPSLEADMGAIAAPPGPGKLEVMGSLRQRALEARERTQAEFDRAFGVNENVAQLRRVMEIDRQQASSPFYRAFSEAPVGPSPEIDAVMPRLQKSGALKKANDWLELEGKPASRGFIDNDLNITRVPTPQAFQYAKEALDDQIGGAMKAGEKGAARRLVDLKHDLIDALDNHPAVGDVWKQARSTYAQPSEIIKGLELGKSVLTNKMDPDELPFLTSAYSDPQMRALRIGMRSYLERLLGKRGTLTAETINTVLSPNNIQKMRWAIGDQATDTLVNAMEHEQYMHNAQTRVWGGSPTALRLEAQKRWTAQPGALDNVSLSDIAGAAASPVKTAVGAAEKLGLSQRRAMKEARMARMREEASRIFTLQGPERDAVARYLVGEPGGAPMKRGGVVPMMSPRLN